MEERTKLKCEVESSLRRAWTYVVVLIYMHIPFAPLTCLDSSDSLTVALPSSFSLDGNGIIIRCRIFDRFKQR